ncbi:MAG TPA: L-dopachrome tautomerase-related protein [Planctomycetota bacterium]|nr:L-dopachrome tautomerase-related protein [Planctomycetota bacterium]
MTFRTAVALTFGVGLAAWSCQPPKEDPSARPAPPRAPLSAALPIRPLVPPVALPGDRPAGAPLEIVATFRDSMPTGVTVDSDNRLFLSFPRWEDPVAFTVAELKDGRPVPYPSAEMNRLDPARPAGTLISAQAVVVDPIHRLWILDTGRVGDGPIVPGGAKLVCIDLGTSAVTKTITFAASVVLATSYLNDLRFDLRKGSQGTAFITDSSAEGPNGILVVDLATGESRRRLQDHPSTKAVPGFLPFVEGRELRRTRPGQPSHVLSQGVDGLAIGADGRRLYYCPLASRHLYSVDAELLVDESATDEQVAASVRDEGMKPASDGLESDREGRIYATAFETNSIVRRTSDGRYETLAHDPRLLWPDTLALAEDGFLYVTVNQLHRQKTYTGGRDERELPYVLFRVKTSGRPVRLR